MLFGIAAVVAVTVLFTGCSNQSKESGSGATDGKTKITFWAAPNPTQLKYWQEMAADFEKQNEDITVEVSQMKESPSSEATIKVRLLLTPHQHYLKTSIVVLLPSWLLVRLFYH